jgi:hypothetical protein
VPAERRDVDFVLTDKAKLRYKSDDRDHLVYTLELSGYQFGWTKISRGTSYRTIDDTTLGKIARQVHLQLKDFKSALRCDLNWPDYAAILKATFPAEQDKVPSK